MDAPLPNSVRRCNSQGVARAGARDVFLAKWRPEVAGELYKHPAGELHFEFRCSDDLDDRGRRPKHGLSFSRRKSVQADIGIQCERTPRRFRSNIILLRLDGLRIEDVAERMNTSMPTVSMWSNRFERCGLDSLKDKTGRGRKPSIPAAKIERVITEATRPPEGRNRWSVRTMGRHAGMSHSTVQRIWAKNDLKPHVTKTFKLSNDPKFEEKFWDVIGLHLNPPAKALVLCCDEKSQCQALERRNSGCRWRRSGRAR